MRCRKSPVLSSILRNLCTIKMRRRKLLALIGAVAIFFGCLILYRMADYTLYQEDIAHRFEENNLIGQLHKETGNKRINPKLINPFQLKNRTGTYRVCGKPAGEATADVQMLELYKELKFANLDGGVWKQGWNIEYKPEDFSKSKLRVFVVPHSHNDPGWLKTFEDYYASQTRHILNNLVKQLTDDPKKKFIWAEISFFSLWWDEISQETQDKVKHLVENGQLEFVTGGWVMNDEANSHFVSILTQLSEGHLWLKNNVNFKPKNSWSIDPFGKSATMPYILKHMKLDNLIIQRVHYAVKKYLAQQKQLEFKWRQYWDINEETDFFTHMMPFYSYDVPHTCGPDPKVCCQFDFRRLPGHGMSCPWKISPQLVNKKNVAARAELLLDQYRKKSQLYKSNVLLVPLGDDFRYDHVSEWTDQFDNYYKIFEYLNAKHSLNVEAKFGTLDDFFTALHEEMPLENFPSLSGDFFTYADRDDHYWSGYYTSRPFHKSMDRVLMGYLRAAEIIFSLAWSSNSRSTNNWLLEPITGFAKQLRDARRSLSLFQHHDGVTGTARDYVMEDYAKKMFEAMRGCQHVIQQCTHFLLSPPQQPYEKNTEQIYYDIDYIQRHVNVLPERKLIILREGEVKQIVVYNSLGLKRTETIIVNVFTPFVKVNDANGEEVVTQINPHFSQPSIMDESRYEVVFTADVPALGLTTYSLSLRDIEKPGRSKLAEVKVFNSPDPIQTTIAFPNVVSSESVEFSIQNEHLNVGFSETGLMKWVTVKKTSTTFPVHVDFARYLARQSNEKSGAYLFLPDDEASTIRIESPVIRVVEGPIMSSVVVDVPNVKHIVTVYNTPGYDSLGLDIKNIVDIREQNNYELSMRISSQIMSGDEFYTDLNAFQMIKRKRFAKLPLQANFYPLPGMGFIEDKKTRLTVVTAQPLGFTSLKEGQIEIMQDRRLAQDDNRGLGQGVLDNKPTITAFKILIEQRVDCKEHIPNLLSHAAHLASQIQLNPLYTLLWSADTVSDLHATYSAAQDDLDSDINLVISRTLDEESKPQAGVTFHRHLLDYCFDSPSLIKNPVKNGTINLNTFLAGHFGSTIQKTSLSFIHNEGELVDRRQPLSVCPMEFVSLLLTR